MVHKEFVPKGEVVTKELYSVVLNCLLKQIACVRSGVWKNHSCSVLYDHEPVHTAAIVR